MAIRDKIRIEDMSVTQKEELITEIVTLSKKYNVNPRVILEKFIANSDLGVSVINAMTHKREEELLNIMIDTLGPEYVKNIALSDLFNKYTQLLKEKARLYREMSILLSDDNFSDTIRIGNLELLLLQLRDLEEQPTEATDLDDIDTYMSLKDVTILTVLAKVAKEGKVRLNSQQLQIISDKIGVEEYQKILSSYKNGTIAVTKAVMSIIMEITKKKILASKNAKVLEELKEVYFDSENKTINNNIQPTEDGPLLSLNKKQ